MDIWRSCLGGMLFWIITTVTGQIINDLPAGIVHEEYRCIDPNNVHTVNLTCQDPQDQIYFISATISSQDNTYCPGIIPNTTNANCASSLLLQFTAKCAGQNSCSVTVERQNVQPCDRYRDYIHVSFMCLQGVETFNICESKNAHNIYVGYILSPQYPRTAVAASSADCECMLTANNPNMMFRFTVLEFSLGSCETEYVELLHNVSNQNLQPYCNTLQSGTVLNVTGNEITVLYTAHSQTHRGFWVEFYLHSLNHQDYGTINVNCQTITQPTGGGNGNNNNNIVTTMQPPAGNGGNSQNLTNQTTIIIIVTVAAVVTVIIIIIVVVLLVLRSRRRHNHNLQHKNHETTGAPPRHLPGQALYAGPPLPARPPVNGGATKPVLNKQMSTEHIYETIPYETLPGRNSDYIKMDNKNRGPENQYLELYERNSKHSSTAALKDYDYSGYVQPDNVNVGIDNQAYTHLEDTYNPNRQSESYVTESRRSSEQSNKHVSAHL